MAEEELLTEADKASKHNKKFEKDGDTDITAGPRKKGRWCTDVPCCLLFVAHIGLFWYVSFSGFETGNYEKLYLPRDYRGQYCGLDGDWQWESDMNLESFEKQSWTMNITRMFDTVARTLVCGQTGYSVLVGSEVGTPAMTDATFESYCGATHSLTDTLETIASDMTGYVESQVTQFTDPSKAADFLTGDFGEDPFTQVLKTFHKVCASTCGTTQNASENMRSWDYIPDWDISWNGNRDFHASTIWSEFRTQIRDSTATGSAIDTLRQQLTSFRFKALPVSICPYEPQFCVPMPGASFEELSDFNYCTPKVDTSILTDSQAGEVAWQSLNEVAELDVTEDLSSTFGSAWGDVLKTWDVLLIVCVASFVAALVWLILLRFALGPMVWLSIFLCFAIFLAGGVICIARANQCADQGLFESAKSQADAASQQGDSGDNPFERECPGGYSVQGSEIRDLLQICGYVLFALAGVFLLSVICLFCRIRLAIALCKVALQFIYHNPSVLFIPIVQTIIGIIWVVAWTVCTAYLTSSVPDDYVGDRKYSNYDSGSVDCTEEWPAGFVWKDSNSTDCQSDEIGCWKCALPRFILDARFAYSLFSLFWHNCFFVALGQMVLAGAAAIWFFAPREEKGRGNVVLPSLGICLYYHTGTVAFGSLLLAIIKLIKWFLRFLAKQAKAQHNMVMAIVFKCLAYAVWCFEKCVRFLNKNAYIQTALLGTNFLVSAMRAFYLIARNAIRFLVLAGLSHIITMVSKAFIVVATGALGYLILWAMYPEVNAILPTIIYCAIGWMVANLFMNVKEMAVDTMLQCFIATEEMGGDSGFVPNGLKKFVDEKAEEGDGNKGCCCGCWGCTCCC